MIERAVDVLCRTSNPTIHTVNETRHDESNAVG